MTFVLRSGDLAGSGHFSGPNRALEGTRGHQRLQKSRPRGYAPEVVVSHEIETEDFILHLKGRIDGVLPSDGTALIEEIKTVTRLWSTEADPLHWAQAKIYAYLYAHEHGLARAEVQITYLELDSLLTAEFKESFGIEILRSFFDSVLSEYLEWMAAHHRWLNQRDRSIEGLVFPFSSYRPGQRSLAIAVYRAIKSRTRLFAEAPTGIGKTMSVLFPALKAMGEGHVEKIFYTTAKTIGRAVAEKSLADLRAGGLRARSVTITARDKICFNDGQPCDATQCPFAIGYYDRIKMALKSALAGEEFTRPEIESIARTHQVCPFELSLDLAVWADVIICDYNYVFDPSVSLRRFFSEERREFAILIDEAHNLVDRAREMFSADLNKDEIASLKTALKAELPGCARLLARINARFLQIPQEAEWEARDGSFVRKLLWEKLSALVREFCREAERWLAQNHPAGFRQPLLDLYFQCTAFLRISELYDERYVMTFDPASGLLRLFCVDPSRLLRNTLESLGAAVFFSATLSPIDYFAPALGGAEEFAHLQLDSPFPPANLGLVVHTRVSTRFGARDQSYQEIVESIAAMVEARAGNYLVYFSSYDYLQEVALRFSKQNPQHELATQTGGMSESAREEFIARFKTGGDRSLVAFAVLGGIFGEGIDLVGEKLIGVAVVGIGLPQLSLERDVIRDFWQNASRPGFEFAYRFPGMNRVLQAAGRVIRSERDRGIVLLMDDRFARADQRELFPRWWKPHRVSHARQIAVAARQFWEGNAVAEHSAKKP